MDLDQRRTIYKRTRFIMPRVLEQRAADNSTRETPSPGRDWPTIGSRRIARLDCWINLRIRTRPFLPSAFGNPRARGRFDESAWRRSLTSIVRSVARSLNPQGRDGIMIYFCSTVKARCDSPRCRENSSFRLLTTRAGN